MLVRRIFPRITYRLDDDIIYIKRQFGNNASAQKSGRRAGLAVTSDGPALGLCDAEGRIRAGLAVNPAGPAFVLLDPQEKILFSAP